MTPRKILICGLPGSGKTTLAKALAPLINAVHYDGDEVRSVTLNDDFSVAGRAKQVVDMRWLCDKVRAAGQNVIASFICPTAALREVFAADYTILMDTSPDIKYADTRVMWEYPSDPDWTVRRFGTSTDSISSVDMIVADLNRPAPSPYAWNNEAPTGLVLGRFQPFHAGHKALVDEALKRYPQVMICVRSMPVSDKNPYTSLQARNFIWESVGDYGDRVRVLPMPNIASVLYGREVGYKLERVHLDTETELISATAIRAQGVELCENSDGGC
jgi:cytidyltransferase-like protein